MAGASTKSLEADIDRGPPPERGPACAACKLVIDPIAAMSLSRYGYHAIKAYAIRLELARTLTESLKLQQPPVAVCFTDTVPAGVGFWSGRSPAGCRFWQEAGSRVFATVAGDHSLCSIGQYTHNLEMTLVAAKDLGDALKVFAELGYVREQDIPQIPVLASKPKYVIYGPLAEIPIDPDVVLLFVRAGQTLVLWKPPNSWKTDCHPRWAVRPARSYRRRRIPGRSALSLGCCGARAYLDVLSDDIALYALPGAALSAFAERIAALSNANSVLAKFHQIRRKDVEAGNRPTIQESLVALQAAG